MKIQRSLNFSLLVPAFLALAQTLAFGAADPYSEVYRSVDRSRLEALIKDMSGANPVRIGNETFTISDRYLPASKARYRAYWKSYFESLKIPVQELAYPTAEQIGETEGHNLEAVIPGASPDSIVIIVHYDSIGLYGNDNPGADDDMTGMATLMETARILSKYRGRLAHTVRFVASDYEEHPYTHLEGARRYAEYISALAKAQGFKILAAIDNEQSGWNCLASGACEDHATAPTFDVFTCSFEDGINYRYDELGKVMASVDAAYASSPMRIVHDCASETSDGYALGKIGVPTLIFSEHEPFHNPHFDWEGGDTFDKIDMEYYFSLARIGVTFAAKMVGILPVDLQ